MFATACRSNWWTLQSVIKGPLGPWCFFALGGPSQSVGRFLELWSFLAGPSCSSPPPTWIAPPPSKRSPEPPSSSLKLSHAAAPSLLPPGHGERRRGGLPVAGESPRHPRTWPPQQPSSRGPSRDLGAMESAKKAPSTTHRSPTSCRQSDIAREHDRRARQDHQVRTTAAPPAADATTRAQAPWRAPAPRRRSMFQGMPAPSAKASLPRCPKNLCCRPDDPYLGCARSGCRRAHTPVAPPTPPPGSRGHPTPPRWPTTPPRTPLQFQTPGEHCQICWALERIKPRQDPNMTRYKTEENRHCKRCDKLPALYDPEGISELEFMLLSLGSNPLEGDGVALQRPVLREDLSDVEAELTGALINVLREQACGPLVTGLRRQAQVHMGDDAIGCLRSRGCTHILNADGKQTYPSRSRKLGNPPA